MNVPDHILKLNSPVNIPTDPVYGINREDNMPRLLFMRRKYITSARTNMCMTQISTIKNPLHRV